MPGQDPAERRVVVTGPPRRARRAFGYYRPRTEIDEQTTLGHTYVRSLMRTQLRAALAVFAFLVLLGLWYVRRAERNERDFVRLVEDR